MNASPARAPVETAREEEHETETSAQYTARYADRTSRGVAIDGERLALVCVHRQQCVC